MVRHATSLASDGLQFESSPVQSRSHSPLAPDVKRALTAAVAQELHKIHGGNEILDWLEAEILVDGVLERGGLERG